MAINIFLIIFGGQTIAEIWNLWWCQIVLGVKLSAVSNCPPCMVGVKLSYFAWWCQIVLGVKLSSVSNCPLCLHGVKLSYLPLWCQIVLGVKLSSVSNCPRCQMVLGSKFSIYLPLIQILIQEDFFFEFKDKKLVQWCNKYLHENSWFLQCASLVLAKRIHFPTKSSWLLIAILQRLRSKEKVISDN